VSRVSDTNLYNAQGKELGDVERVVLGPGCKQYIVIGAGEFLGFAEKHVAIAAERVTVRGARLITQGLAENQIRAMPSFDRNISLNAIGRSRSLPLDRNTGEGGRRDHPFRSVARAKDQWPAGNSIQEGVNL
jgi:hypothetical protein